MKLNFFQKKAAIPQGIGNPTNFHRGFMHEDSNSIVQIFHKMNFHVLEPFYKYAIREFASENVLCMVALLDFEMLPKTEKRDFIMSHFIEGNSPFEVNIPSETRTHIQNQVAQENRTKALAQNRRRGAFIRHENRPIMLSQLPTTFGNLQEQLLLNLHDTWQRYENNESPSGGDHDFLKCQQLALAMLAVGFNVPQFMFTMKAG